MSTWSYYTFDNDAAADFAESFLENPNEAVLYEALATAAEEEGQLEADDASVALAAAEIVAAILGKPAQDLPPGLIPAIVHLDADGEDLRELAEQAVKVVLEKSVLQEQRAAGDEYSNWQGLQQNLLTRLQDADEE
ncbi:DUF4259 domain-containing protein [Hymenobacter tibetensis]|uniref:DUF4259 domain-containing protein n=1 Tax=Hymenobacter tibetensis TaxID=497967 RepID=A0ABY4CRN0_9BACT|nr:DUF4259 domain-containing protein [Hymenobacter tibetensis]UOG72752.1 DUF4259 domain-containing protein [Hymenobacter tibetensis]